MAPFLIIRMAFSFRLDIVLFGFLFCALLLPVYAEEDTLHDLPPNGTVYEEDLSPEWKDETPSSFSPAEGEFDEPTAERDNQRKEEGEDAEQVRPFTGHEDDVEDVRDEEQVRPSESPLPSPAQEETPSLKVETRENFAPSSEISLPQADPPRETLPFLFRPTEWEVSPPTVTGIPALPALASLSAQELIALGFAEDGKALFDKQDQEGAWELFERAIGLAPFQPYSYYFLGRIAFARGDHKQAIAFLQKAELLFARADRAWLGETSSLKGTVYEDLQDYEHARVAYRRSLRFVPTNLKVLSALARLPEEEPLPSDAPPIQ